MEIFRAIFFKMSLRHLGHFMMPVHYNHFLLFLTSIVQYIIMEVLPCKMYEVIDKSNNENDLLKIFIKIDLSEKKKKMKSCVAKT